MACAHRHRLGPVQERPGRPAVPDRDLLNRIQRIHPEVYRRRRSTSPEASTNSWVTWIEPRRRSPTPVAAALAAVSRFIPRVVARTVRIPIQRSSSYIIYLLSCLLLGGGIHLCIYRLR